MVQEQLPLHGTGTNQTRDGVVHGVDRQRLWNHFAVPRGHQSSARRVRHPVGGVFLHFEVHLHIKLDQRVLVVDDATSQLGRPRIAKSRQGQWLGWVFQEEVGCTRGLGAQTVNAYHTVRSRTKGSGHVVRQEPFVSRSAEFANHVACGARVQQQNGRIALRRQVFSTLHDLGVEFLQEGGRTPNFSQVRDAHTARLCRRELLCKSEGIDFKSQWLASQLVERQFGVASAVVHLPRTHDHVAGIGNRSQQSIALEEELKAFTQSGSDGIIATLRKCGQCDFSKIGLIQLAEVHAIAHTAIVVLTHAIVHFIANAVGILVSVFAFT